MGAANSNYETELPMELIKPYLSEYLMNSKRPMISVGSGIGKLEKSIETSSGKTIICVDPEPYSYNRANNIPSDIMHLPDYPIVDNLLSERPELKQSCDLMLIWPSPNASIYDLEAINKLQPVNIFIIYEYSGIAGGYHLHYWIQNYCDHLPNYEVPSFLPTPEELDQDLINEYKSRYESVTIESYVSGEGFDRFQHVFLHLEKINQ